MRLTRMQIQMRTMRSITYRSRGRQREDRAIDKLDFDASCRTRYLTFSRVVVGKRLPSNYLFLIIISRKKFPIHVILCICSPNEEWDIYWVDVGSMKELFDHGYFEEHMRINHFRNHYEVKYCLLTFL